MNENETKREKLLKAFDTQAQEQSALVADAIRQVATAAQRLLTSGLTKRAVVVLIQDLIPANARGQKLGKGDIEAVLDAAANLGKFVEKPKAKS